MNPDKEVIIENQIFNDKIKLNETVQNISFIKCKFINCKFLESIFINCYFDECEFVKCDLSLIKIKGTSFTSVKISECKAIGIMWVEASSPFSINLYKSKISFSSFFSKNLKKMDIVECEAEDVDFAECNLANSNFKGTDLRNSRFVNCDLSFANFDDAINYSISLTANKIKKTRFSLPEAASLLSNFDVIISN